MRNVNKLIAISALIASSAQASLASYVQANGDWTDGTTTMHVVPQTGGLAISGYDKRSVFLMNCRMPGAKKDTNRYICQGHGYNENGAFELQSIVEFAAGTLNDSWSAEQSGKLWTGDSVLKPATVGPLPKR